MLASVALLAAAIAALGLRAERPVRRAGLALLALLCLQLTIGMTMVLRGFPLWLATAHNAGAALLLLATLALNQLPAPRQTMSRTDAQAVPIRATWRDYLELTKPRVVALIVLTAIVGTLLATPGLPPLDALVFGNLGIALAAASAAAINHVLDRRIDARMARTRNRPCPRVISRAVPGAGFRAGPRRGLDDHPGRVRERTDGRADLPVADPVRRGLYGVAQARDAAEHRDRRRRRRRTAGAGLGRGDRPRRCHTRCCCS
jgi:hypothetical protein